MSHYKIKYGQSEGKRAQPPKELLVPKQHNLRRIYQRAFKSGRKLGYDQGYTEGFDAGYEKGYTEGSSLGYNNGFLSGIDISHVVNKTQQAEGKIISALQSLISKKYILIYIEGEKKHEAKLLFKQLGISVEKGPG